MTEPELIEALAKRLFNTVDGNEGRFENQPKLWYGLARECLRQMEWARRRTVSIELGTILAARDRGVGKICTFDPLTLAPEGWEP